MKNSLETSMFDSVFMFETDPDLANQALDLAPAFGINLATYASLDAFSDAVRGNPDRPVIINRETSPSIAETDQAIAELVRWSNRRVIVESTDPLQVACRPAILLPPTDIVYALIAVTDPDQARNSVATVNYQIDEYNCSRGGNFGLIISPDLQPQDEPSRISF